MKTVQNKLNTIYGVKHLTLKVEDVDEASRTVKGYLSSFDTLDSDNDIIRKGSFKKSLQERGTKTTSNRQIAHLRNHDWEHQIGKFTELEEDSFGLKFVSELGRSTKGNDALLDYQDGILNEHSIGFNYIKDKIKFIEDDSSEGGYFEIVEVKLWEGSGVTFGANEFTPTLEASKSIMDSEYLAKLNAEMDSLVKAIKNGKGTDERLENIELRFKQIQQKYNTLIDMESFNKDTPVDEPDTKDLELQKLEQDRKNFYLNIIK